ncbi:hypothetical protein ACJEEI_16730, partial [Bacteroides uniformis]|uniref:hypothetical protein n=1 Tax=Bacteroides uniformis TaxID=820 RepID=UPI00397B4AAC
STTFQEPSTDIGYKKKKRLAKSGKDSVVTSLCKRRYMPGKDSLHTGVKAVTYRGKGSYILG